MQRPTLAAGLIVFLSCLDIGLIGSRFALGMPRKEAEPTSQIEFIPPKLPDRGRPEQGRREGGASRGRCTRAETQPPLTALMPAISPDEGPDVTANELVPNEAIIGFTTEAFPTLWFYVPYPLDGNRDLEFVIQDEEDNIVYQDTLRPVTAGPGILRLDWPTTVELMPMKSAYAWFLVVQCEQTSPDFVSGWVYRDQLSAALRSQINQSDLRNQAALYAANGIWHDALKVVAEAYQANPQDPNLQADWASLLGSVDLEHISSEPLLNCCSTSNN